MSRNLAGIHDPGGEHLFGGDPGWVVVTESIGSDPNDQSGRDYRYLSDQGIGVIVRLNYSHHGQGTIPTPDRYADFAKRCANFVRNSQGCTRWIIGNEPNHAQERPGGEIIVPLDYARCYRLCHEAIHAVQPEAEVLVAAVAPWDVTTTYPGNRLGDWLVYFQDICVSLVDIADGFAMHTYTHGSEPELVTSRAKMDAPYNNRHYNFLAYRDFVDAIPASRLRGVPIYITETDQIVPWLDVDNGWMSAALGEIDAWNRNGGQPILCVCFYRWLDHDKWGWQNKPNVQQMFRNAVSLGYRSPVVSEETPVVNSEKSDAPVVSNARYVPREWDKRLEDRGVSIESAPPGPAYRVVAARWYDVNEVKQIGPDHHILVDVLDANGNRKVGQRVRFFWPGGSVPKGTDAKPGEIYAVDMPMSPGRNAWSVQVDGVPSDKVVGIDMGADMGDGYNAAHHTSTHIVFQWVESDQHEAYLPYVSNQQPGSNSGSNAQPAPGVDAPGQNAIERNGVPRLVHPVADERYQRVTQPYGVNREYYQQFKVDGVALQGHNGVDFGTPIGTPIVAVDVGRVVEVADEGDKGYGRYVKVSHAWGESLYAHLDTQVVTVGQHVGPGQRLGTSGNTGNSTGPHLHFGLRVAPFDRKDGMGGFTDPLPYLQPAPIQADTGSGWDDDVVWLVGQMAKVLGVDPKLALAFLDVESSGEARAPDVILRLEPHILKPNVDPDWFGRHFQLGEPAWDWRHHRFRDPADGQWKRFHGDQTLEYRAINLAATQGLETALRAVSMGAAQIMGFNHALVGYPSAAAMLEAFRDARYGPANQVIAFFSYCMNVSGLREAMQRRDYYTMARLYNGAGNADEYAALIAERMRSLGG